MNEGLRKVVWRGRSLPALLSLILVAFVFLASAAYAAASSGNTYKATAFSPGSSSYTRICIEAEVDTVPGNYSTTRAYYNYPCSSSRTMSTGYLGTKAWGYRDGSYCGSSGYYYNSSSATGYGIGMVLCSDPAGTQAFHTTALGRIWETWGPDPDKYYYVGSVVSPSQNS